MSDSKRRVLVTIVAHSDLRRIGEQATLDASQLENGIGRDHPEFATHEGPSRPLGIRYISRRPMPAEWRADGIAFGAGPAEDGFEEEFFSNASLSRGILLTLGRRVLLHVRALPDHPEPAPSALQIEQIADQFGRALVEQLVALERSELLESEPPWLPPETMKLVLMQPFDGGVPAVVSLAQQVALLSPDSHARLPEAT